MLARSFLSPTSCLSKFAEELFKNASSLRQSREKEGSSLLCFHGCCACLEHLQKEGKKVVTAGPWGTVPRKEHRGRFACHCVLSSTGPSFLCLPSLPSFSPSFLSSSLPPSVLFTFSKRYENENHFYYRF